MIILQYLSLHVHSNFLVVLIATETITHNYQNLGICRDNANKTKEEKQNFKTIESS